MHSTLILTYICRFVNIFIKNIQKRILNNDFIFLFIKTLAKISNRSYNIIISRLSGLYGVLMSQGRYVQKGDGKKIYLNYRHSLNSSDLVSRLNRRLRRPATFQKMYPPDKEGIFLFR